MTTPSIVVFDIGNVLVDWQPKLAWSDVMSDDEITAFMDRIQFDKLNFACDAGAKFGDAAKDLPNAQDAQHLADYVPRYTRTVPNKLTGTWELLYTMKQAGVPIHAITNWSAETWPEGLKVHPELGEVFETLVVSGEVGMVKPSVQIYRHFCAQAGVHPQDCVFIDDSLHNVVGAKAAGMDAIHFTGAEALKAALTERGLL